MHATLVTKVALPLVLFAVMLGMGLALTPADFRRVGSMPKALIVGLVCQMLLLPLLGYALIGVFPLTHALAVGLMILTFCPGGTASNLLAYLARGDVALSVTLTAVTSLIAPFTLPPLANLVIEFGLGAETGVSLPIGRTIVTLLVLTVLPIGIGMLLKAKRPTLADRSQPLVKLGSMIALLAITVAVVVEQWDRLPEWFAIVGATCLLLAVSSLGVGYLAGVLTRLERAQSITIAIEVGVQNGATALFVTSSLGGGTEAVVPPVIYTLEIVVLASGFAALMHLRKTRQ